MSVNEKMTAIADAIREKTGGTEKLTLDEMPVQIGSIKAVPMWLPYIQTLNSLFAAVTFPENTELVLDIPGFVDKAGETFMRTVNVTSVKLICGNEKSDRISLDGFCRYNSYIRKVDFSECNRLISNAPGAFSYNYALEEIIGTLELIPGTMINEFRNCFDYCQKLREVRFANGTLLWGLSVKQSPLLSDASIQSIIDGLADLTGQTAQTLTLHADVGAKLTDAQKATITVKNWTLVY